MPTHAATTRPTRVAARSELLETTVLRTVGYRAVCRCGWRGDSRRSRTVAVEDKRQHVAEHVADRLRP